MNFFMPGNVRTSVHSENWDMTSDSKIPCSVLKSLEGHETGRQATDLDENFANPYSFSRRFRKSQSRGRFRPSPNRKFNFSLFRQTFRQDFFSKRICVRELPGRVCVGELPRGSSLFRPGQVLKGSTTYVYKTNKRLGKALIWTLPGRIFTDSSVCHGFS